MKNLAGSLGRWVVVLVLSISAAPAPVVAGVGNGVPSVQDFFNGFNKDTMELVDAFYAPNAHFLDPVVDLKGRDAIRGYYANLYANVISIRFEFSGEVTQGDEKVAFWTMVLRHKKLQGGKEVRVIGNSHFKFDPETGQALYHRDTFDMGEFIYEGLPVVGSVIRYVKRKMSQSN